RARHLSSSHVADFQNGLNAPRLKFAFNLGFSLGKFFAVELRPLPLRSGLEARPLPIRLCLLGELKPGRRQAVKAEAAKRGRNSASLYGLTPVRFTVVGSNPPDASSDRIELAFRAPCDGIGDPAVDVGLMPAAPINADLDLRRERALGDLAVDGGPGQPGPGKHGSQADDTVWCAHNRAASCWLSLTASETRQDN